MLTRGALEAVGNQLRDWGEAVRDDLAAEQLTGGRSNLTYALTDGFTTWILRRPPEAVIAASAHDVGREFRITAALAGTAMPVPRSIGWCQDPSRIGAPYSVTEFVDGLNVKYVEDMADWSISDADACAAGLVDALAILHQVDLAAIGLSELGGATPYAARQVKVWAGQWARIGGAGHADAERLAAYLETRQPPPRGRVLTHGDFRIDNALIDPNDTGLVRAVIDWELATTGEPTSDVALMCAYRDPALDAILGGQAAWSDPRFPDADNLAGLYEAASETQLQDWEFYLALAYFKLAVIARGIAYRYEQGAGDAGHASAGEAVDGLMAAGLKVIA